MSSPNRGRLRASRRILDAVAAAAGSVAVAGMVATPLSPRAGAARRVLSNVVVAGLGCVTAAATARRWGPARSAAAAAAVSGATLAVERIGVRTGVPFGRYHYTGALQPTVAGVPAVVPVAWFAMAVPARETAHAVLGPHATPTRRVLLGALSLTAWDLFLDPQMVGEGYWRWERAGRYRGIPLSNFAGWFLTSAGVMVLLELLLPRDPDHEAAPKSAAAGAGADADGRLVGTYAYMAVMETLGFAAFFRDRRVAAVGGAGMLPPAGIAVLRMIRARRG